MSMKDKLASGKRKAIVRALAAYDRESEEHKKIYEDLKEE